MAPAALGTVLAVLVFAAIADASAVTTFNVTEGQALKVTCNTTSGSARWTNNHEFNSPGRILSIPHIKREMAGNYYCYTGIFRKTLVEQIYVNVQYPAKVHITSKHIKPLDENATFSLNVYVEGKPAPATTFTLEDGGPSVYNHTGEGDITITVAHVTCADGGKYRLTSGNIIGNVSKTTEILVNCPPSPRQPCQDKFEPRLGSNVDVKVASLGYPYPNCTWLFKGRELPCKAKHFENDLHLENFTLEEFGSYTLRLENDFGESNHTFDLVADGPPDRVTQLSVNNVTQTSANVTWMAGYDYGARQNFIIKNYNGSAYEDVATLEEKDGEHGLLRVSHVVDDLEPGMTYNLSVVANNSRGEAPISSNSAAFTAAPYTRFPVVEFKALFVKCNGSSPRADVYWSNSDGSFRKQGPQFSVFNATRNYTGIYNCIENANMTIIILETIFVDVLYQAKILSFKTSSTNLNVSDTFTVMLTIEGNPAPVTTLSQAGESPVTTNQTGTFNISIKHVACTQSQSVQLACANTLDNDTRTMTLNVHCPPSPKNGSNEFAPRLGDSVRLTVENVGYPFPRYSWSHEGRVLANDTGDNRDEYTVRGVKIDDFGVYTVTMTNILGSASYNYSIDADGPPDPVTKLSVNNITTNSANITFVSGYNYGAKQTFTVQNFNEGKYEDITTFDDPSKGDKPSTVSHVILGLAYNTAYNVTVVANNSRGESNRSASCVPFSTKEPFEFLPVLEGNNFTIRCNGTNLTDVHWEDNTGKRISMDEELVVSNISRNDTGFYKCYGKAGLTTRKLIEEIFIDVQFAARILRLSVKQQYLHPNDSYTLDLEVEGHPAPNVSFVKLREGAVVFSRNTTGNVSVTIDPVQCTDLGTYELLVTNQIASDFKNESIFVNCPPVVDPKAHIQTKLYPRLGNLTQLMIENYGYPYPNYTWHHNKTAIAKHNDSNFGSSVTINVTVGDYGSYDVDIANDLGQMDVTFQIIAEGVPDPVTNVKVDNFTYNSAILSWTSGFNYGSKQTFKLMMENGKGTFTEFTDFSDKSNNGLEKGDYVVTGLNSSSLYKFAVVSANKNGTSSMSDVESFTTADAPSEGSKSHNKAIIGGLLGALCGLAILVAIAIFLKRRRDRRRMYQTFEEEE